MRIRGIFLGLLVVSSALLFASAAHATNYCGTWTAGEARNEMKRSSMKVNGDQKWLECSWSVGGVCIVSKWKEATVTKWLGAGGSYNNHYTSTGICDSDFIWPPWDSRWAARMKVSWRTGVCRGEYPNRTCTIE